MAIEFEILLGDDRQVKVLYELLSKRNHKISHQQMPSYAQHTDFVKNHPYLSWFLVKAEGRYIGSFYVTDQNTIGINIMDEYIGVMLPLVIEYIQSHFIPLPAIKSIRSGVFSINVAPRNADLIAALERNGYILSQLSFVIK